MMYQSRTYNNARRQESFGLKSPMRQQALRDAEAAVSRYHTDSDDDIKDLLAELKRTGRTDFGDHTIEVVECHPDLVWAQEFSLDGRHVKISDGTETFCANVPDDMDLDDAIADYVRTADYDDNLVALECTLFDGAESSQSKTVRTLCRQIVATK